MKRTTDDRPQITRGMVALGLACGLLLAWLGSAGGGAAQGGATVSGTVTNQTPGGAVPAGLIVNLYTFNQALEQTGLYTTTTDTAGAFSFTGLTLQPEATCFTRVVYQDTVYLSEPGTFITGQTTLTLPIQIAEPTEDDTRLEVTQLHLFLAVTNNTLQVAEYYLVSNTGNRTVIGRLNPDGYREVVTIPLPVGATALTFPGPGLGARYQEQAGLLVDTQPVAPGTATSQIRFSYQLPYQSGMVLRRGLELPIQAVVILLVDEGLTLSGTGLVQQEATMTQLGPAQTYTAGPLAAGEALAFTLSGSPQPPISSAGQSAGGAETSTPLPRNPLREAGIGVLVLAAALVVVYALWWPANPVALPARARPLVEAIAALDEDFEAGKLEAAAYRQKRAALKRQVQAVVTAENQHLASNSK